MSKPCGLCRDEDLYAHPDCMWCRCPCHTITDTGERHERRVIPDGPPLVYGRDYSFPEGAERPDAVDNVVAITITDDQGKHGDDGGGQ